MTESTVLTEPVSAMKEVLAARASFYDLLAALYFKPLSQEQIDNIAAMNLSSYANVNDDFAQGVNDITRYLAKQNTGTRQELAVDFTGAFGGTSSWKGLYAVPYESVFTSEEGLLFRDSFHEVYALFNQSGVRRAEGYDYPDDHLSFMCEFQAILSNRAIEALGRGDKITALDQITLSQRFLQEHILNWFDDFHSLALNLLKTRFYRGVMSITRGFFALDLEVTDDLVAEL